MSTCPATHRMYHEKELKFFSQENSVRRAVNTIKGHYKAYTSRNTPVYITVKGDDDVTSCGSSDTAHDDASERNYSTHRCGSENFSRTISILTTVILTIIACSLAFRILHQHTQHPTRPTLTCGNTQEEAVAKGCVFDPLYYQWTPLPCHEAETANEFRTWLARPDLDRGSFPFFADKFGEHHIDGEEALSQRVGGPDGVKTYATQQEHIAHCVFAIRRYIRISQHPERRMIGDSVPHLMHCLGQLEDDLAGNRTRHRSLGSSFRVSFGSC